MKLFTGARFVEVSAKLFAFVAAAALIWLTLPGDYLPMTRGLDLSWAYAINAAPGLGLQYGRDILFTFGPLGRLLAPMALGDNVLYALIFNLILHLLFFSVLLLNIKVGAGARVLMFAPAWLILIGAGLLREYQWLLLPVLLLGTALQYPCYAAILTASASVLAAVFLHVKFSLGIGALGTLGLFHLLNCAFRNPGCVRRVCESVLTVLLSAGGFFLLLFAGLADYCVWLRGSWELSAGYSAAMSLPGSGVELGLGLFLLAVYLICMILALARDRLSGAFLVLTGFLCFIVFKHAFVRQDGHVAAFFTTLPAIFAVWLLFVRRPALFPAVTALLLSVALALGIGSKYGHLNGDNFYKLITGRTAGVRVDYLRHKQAVDDLLGGQLQRGLLASAVTAPVIDEIRAGGYGVDVVPWELSYIPANGLRWRAQPLLQLYCAYTPWLDEFAAKHYRGSAAPEFLLLHYGSLDRRYLAWDAPLCWQTILRHYIWRADAGGELTVLRRRAAPLADNEFVGDALLSDDEWLAIPESEQLLFAHLDLPVSRWGRLLQFFFRLPPLVMEVEYNQGQRYQFQLTPAVAGHGIQINYLPERHSQMAQFMRGEVRYRVRGMRLAGAGRKYYPRNIQVRWSKLPFAPDYRPYYNEIF